MKLVLVESPTKARKLTGYLGNEYVVRASIGHIRDLPKSKLGIDVNADFTPEYIVPRDKAPVVKSLKELAARAEQIILATDPDREGEAIGWHLREILSNAAPVTKVGRKTKKTASTEEEVISNDRFVRATFHEITKSAILDAINNPAELNMALVDAQQARRVVDRLVGYSVSPVLWKKIRYGLSAGRVQSVALRLIVEREREIEQFIPQEYWEVDVLLNTDLQASLGEKKYFKNNTIEEVPTGMFVARVVSMNAKEYSPTTEADVTPVLQELEHAQYVVISVEKKERRRVSLPPFTTSTLQQQGATRYGYTSKTTMRLAQQLYEEGLITYHRTDSVNLASQALDMAREYIVSQYGREYLPETPRFFANKSKNAQEAHEAIRPTDVRVSLDDVRAKLSEQHAKLYDLIWRRFVASQMESAVYDQTTILIEATPENKERTYGLKSTGSTLKFAGWMTLFPNQGDVILPSVDVQQKLGFTELNGAQKFTQPPPRYNDASLIKTLEAEGIGRPSTYASIISVIEERGYVERKEKKFFPTAIGKAVNDFLVKHFTDIVDYKFTANMEDNLDAVARGEKEWQRIVADFYAPLEKIVNSVVEKAERAEIPVEATDEDCPKCGATEYGRVVIRTGKFGKFRSCNRFPNCDFTENIVNKIEGAKCPLCQEGDVVIKPTRYGKEFFSCSRYPTCDWASWTKPVLGSTLTKEEWEKMKAEREARRAAKVAEGKTGKGRSSGKRTFRKTTKKAASKK